MSSQFLKTYIINENYGLIVVKSLGNLGWFYESVEGWWEGFEENFVELTMDNCICYK